LPNPENDLLVDFVNWGTEIGGSEKKPPRAEASESGEMTAGDASHMMST
jgi:hypothetical protein